MNILVTGANGQLGNEMRIVAKDSKDKYIFTDVIEVEGQETIILDITNIDAVRNIVREYGVNVIVNCAAWTNVDAAEDPEKYDLVELLNAKAPENLALSMKEVDGLLVHISTDYVFGGDPYNTPCKEDQKGTPTGVYGLTKLHGEQNIQASGVDYIILRTAWLYSEFGKNFIKTMLNLTATKPQLKVVFDQVGTPTYAYDLAQAIVTILDDYKKSITDNLSPISYAKSGVYHFSNEGVCSWYDFTKMIQQIALELGYYESLPKQGDLEGHCDILPCHSNEFPSPVKRPAYSVLDKTKVKQMFNLSIPYWTESLKQCIANLMHQ
jgi:dTDP-4-dehydrorhamnose reductase